MGRSVEEEAALSDRGNSDDSSRSLSQSVALPAVLLSLLVLLVGGVIVVIALQARHYKSREKRKDRDTRETVRHALLCW